MRKVSLTAWLVMMANLIAKQICESRMLEGYDGHGLAG